MYNRPGRQGESGFVIRASGRQADIPHLTCPYDPFSIPSQEEEQVPVRPPGLGSPAPRSSLGSCRSPPRGEGAGRIVGYEGWGIPEGGAWSCRREPPGRVLGGCAVHCAACPAPHPCITLSIPAGKDAARTPDLGNSGPSKHFRARERSEVLPPEPSGNGAAASPTGFWGRGIWCAWLARRSSTSPLHSIYGDGAVGWDAGGWARRGGFNRRPCTAY